MRRANRLFFTLVALLASCVLATGIAHATIVSSTAAEAATWSTGTVAAATAPQVSSVCGATGSLSATATLTWTTSSSANATAVTILRQISPAALSAIATLSPGATSYLDTGLTVNTTYGYVVRTDVYGFYADASEVSTTTPLVCL